MQDFEDQLAKDVPVAHGGIAYTFRSSVSVTDVVDDVHHLHAAVAAQGIDVLAGLPRALQSEEGGDALL